MGAATYERILTDSPTDEYILDYAVPELDETYIAPVDPPTDFAFRSLMDLQPTPVMMERRIPPNYSSVQPIVAH